MKIGRRKWERQTENENCPLSLRGFVVKWISVFTTKGAARIETAMEDC